MRRQEESHMLSEDADNPPDERGCGNLATRWSWSLAPDVTLLVVVVMTGDEEVDEEGVT